MQRIQELMDSALRHHQAGRLSQAEPLYQDVLQLDPEHADALHFLGVLSHQLGRHEVAVVLISRAIVRNGSVPSFHNNLGNALRALGKLDEAENCYRQALAHLQAYPDAHYNLGGTLQAQGRLEAAAAAYAHALSLRPEFAEGYNQLGIVLFELGKLDEAVAAFARAVTYRPQYPEALSNLATALRQQGKRSDAQALYRGALALKPDYAVAALGLSIAAIPVMPDTPADSVGAAESFERALDELQAWDRSHPGLLGSAVGAAQPFSLAYRPVDVTVSLSRYGELVSGAAMEYWGSRLDGLRAGAGRPGQAGEVGAPRPAAGEVGTLHAGEVGTPCAAEPVPPAYRERIRLVIVSGQIRRTHPVWEIVLRGLIAHLDRQKFEVFLYHTGHQTDDETDWARANVDRFVHGARSTEELLALIGLDQPDVLFYPEIGMDPPSCALAALRLAPLQIASWGHPVTTGLPTVDWFVSGELLEGPAAQ